MKPMTDSRRPQDPFAGLCALVESAFPRTCPKCRRTFASVEDFLVETQPLQRSTGLKESVDDAARPIVALFRNCLCGSTLMEFFQDRRNQTETGLWIRRQFQVWLEELQATGLDEPTARKKLLERLRTGREG